MRIEAAIPEALHLCPTCDELASGELYCDACRRAAEFYDTLFVATGYRASGETQAIEDGEPDPGGMIRGAMFALALEAWAVAMGIGVHYIWHHWK